MPRSWKRSILKFWMWRFLFFLGITACLKSIVDLGKILLFVFRGVLDRDLMVYFVMGRSLLNGLTPYIEMYDSKPPGMYVLTAASLFFTRGEGLLLFLQICVLLGIPAIFYLATMRTRTTRGFLEKTVIALASICFAAQITLFLEERAGQGEIQSIGALCAALALLGVMCTPQAPRWYHTVCIAIPLACSFWLFEPFVLVAPLAILLLCRSKNEILRFCVIPVIFAGCLTLIANLIVGGMGYFTAYLSLMLHSRIYEGNNIPLFVRGWNAQWILLNTVGRMYPAAPYLGFLLMLAWAFVPFSSVPRHHKKYTTLLYTTLAFLSGFGLFLKMFAFLIPDERYAHLTHPVIIYFKTTAGWHITLAIFLLCVVAIIRLLRRESLPVFYALIVSLIAVYGTSIAMGLSYSGNHFAFATVLFIAVGMILMRSLMQKDFPTGVTVGVLLGIFALGFSYHTQAKHLEYLVQRLGFGYHSQKELVDTVDAMLDQCSFERYFSDGDEQLVFTRHTPWGPVNFGGPHTYLPTDHYLNLQLRENLAVHNRIFIFKEERWKDILNTYDKNSLNGFLKELIEEKFTENALVCAQSFLPIKDFRIFFRIE